MNKRGLTFQLAGIVILGLVALTLIIAFLFSSSIRLTLIGIGLIASGIFLTGAIIRSRSKTPRQVYAIIVGLVTIGILLVFLPSFGITSQTLFGATNVQIGTDGQRVIVTATPSADQLVVQLSANELNQQLENFGYGVTQGVTINFDFDEYTNTYPLIRESNEVFEQPTLTNTGNYFTGSFSGTSTSTLVNECRNRGRTTTIHAFVDTNAGFSPDLYCVHLEPWGFRGHQNGNVITDFEIDVSVSGGGTQTLTRNNPQLSFLGGDVFVEFTNELVVSPTQLESLPFDVLWRNGAFRFLITDNALSLQNTRRTQYLSCVQGLANNNVNSNENCLLTYEQNWFNIFEDRGDDLAPNIVTGLNVNTGGGGGTGSLIVSLEPDQIPVITMTIDGDFLGLIPLVGDPEITQCVPNINTESGNTNVLNNQQFKVKNVGSDDATFLISTSCSNPNLDVLTVSSTSVNEGQTKTLGASITGASSTVGQPQSGTCTITVKDSNQPSNVDTCSFNVNIEFTGVTCSPNTVFCSADGTQVVSCDSSGLNQNVVQTCSSGQACGQDNNGDVTCVSTNPLSGVFDPNLGLGGNNQGGSTGGTGSSGDVTQTSCNQLASENPLLGYTFVQSQQQSCGFFCTLGLQDPTTTNTNQCVAKNIPILILGSFILLMVIIITLILVGRRPRKSRSKTRRRR